MTLFSDTYILISGFVLLVTLALLRRSKFRMAMKSRNHLSLPFPPGPTGVPLLGNIHQMPVKDAWLQFREWSKVYGDVLHLSILGKDIIVLTSYESADKLLNKRGAMYSSRPRAPVMADHGGWYYNLACVPTGELMHGQRRLLNQFLNPSAVRKYEELLTKKARSLAFHTSQKPACFQAHSRMHTTASVMKIAYGFEVVSEDDQAMREAEDAVKSLEVIGTPGSHPIDMFPILGKLPLWIWGQTFAKGMEQMRKGAYNVGLKPYTIVRNQMAAGEATPSMASELIESHTLPDGSIKDEEVVWAALSHVYFAGADTTSSAIDTFVLAMMIYPKVQEKARQELDHLLQGERLPTLADRGSLPYLHAVMKETLRWKPVLPLGLPHLLERDDIYNGMFLPAGAVVLSDIYSMSFDAKCFRNPFEFDPSRFLDYSQGRASLRTDIASDPEDITFGFGRRICPGRHLASSSLWITMATLLTFFEIKVPKDQDGKEIMPNIDYVTHIVSHPEPYRGDFVSRSKTVLEILVNSIEGVQNH
ncbi:cytochrome P450 [Sistotremastrum suecicum HHB10207 ss-3]|uniref:Cytochrome P450 n=1 Tax=Sistotremastrum suecicum HHB10207 ss-3 TaxID=1314776 RepID=A0A166FM97_9AGAM|nr:cytochrome P450 [Sistotremastrum suecicum HHB10207 ss-3]